MAKINSVIEQLKWKQACWDEIAVIAQWQIGGHINYCTLIGIPPPSELHLADSSLQALVLRTLRVRFSAEHKDCLAPYSVGGLQIPSVVGSTVAAVARDLNNLLNGE